MTTTLWICVAITWFCAHVHLLREVRRLRRRVDEGREVPLYDLDRVRCRLRCRGDEQWQTMMDLSLRQLVEHSLYVQAPTRINHNGDIEFDVVTSKDERSAREGQVKGAP